MASEECVRILVEAINRLENEGRSYKEELRANGDRLTQLLDVVSANELENKRREKDRVAFEQSVLEMLRRELQGQYVDIEDDKKANNPYTKAGVEKKYAEEVRNEESDNDEVVFIKSNESKLDMKPSLKFWKPSSGLASSNSFLRKKDSGSRRSCILDETVGSSKECPNYRYIGRSESLELNNPKMPRNSAPYDGLNNCSKLGQLSSNFLEHRTLNVGEHSIMQSGKCKCGPFTLKETTSKKMEDTIIIEYIFDKTLNPLESIITTDRLCVTRTIMMCLAPGHEIIDDIIDVVSEYLTIVERGRNGEKLSSWVMTSRLSPAGLGVFSRRMEDFLPRLNSAEFFTGSIEACETIFIPVADSRHWFLYVVRVKDEVCELWDSLLSGTTCIGQVIYYDVMRNLDMLMSTDNIMKKRVQFSFTRYKLVVKDNVPQQTTVNDCGVYVIRFMLLRDNIFKKNFKDWSSDDERYQLLRRIALSDYNQSKKDLIHNANEHFKKKNLGNTLDSDEPITHKRVTSLVKKSRKK